jgi:hypothetical protein
LKETDHEASSSNPSPQPEGDKGVDYQCNKPLASESEVNEVSEALNTITGVLAELESLQRQAGELQLNLLRMVTDDKRDEWDEPAQAALLKLETVQRTIGEAQVVLVQRIPTGLEIACDADSPDVQPKSPQPRGPNSINKQQPEAAPAKGPVVWLREHAIKIKTIQPVSGLDEIADRAALFLGDRFEKLRDFYEMVKRRVEGRSRHRYYPAADLPSAVVSDICLFGTQLLGSGFFVGFTYFKRGLRSDPDHKPVIRFDPLEDSRVRYFFTGGWLERYVFQVVRTEVCKAHGRWDDEQMQRGVRVELPNGRDAEFDVLVGLPGNGILWIECKSGEWQSSIPRLRDLGKRFLGLPPARALLVVVDPLTQEQLASAKELTGMSVVQIGELRDWLSGALSLEAGVPSPSSN